MDFAAGVSVTALTLATTADVISRIAAFILERNAAFKYESSNTRDDIKQLDTDIRQPDRKMDQLLFSRR